MFGNFLFKNKNNNHETEIEELYRKHKSRLFNIAMRYLHNYADAEDAVHSVFSQIIEEKTKIFEIPPNKQAAYLNVLIRNISARIFNNSLNEVAVDPAELEEYSEKNSIDDDIGLDDTVISKISHRELIDFIHTLPQGMREAMVLKYLIGLSDKESAAKLDITENALRQDFLQHDKQSKNLLIRVKKTEVAMSNELLKNILQEICDDEFAEYDTSEEHKFSFRHRRKMKKLFREYNKKYASDVSEKKRFDHADVLPLL